MTLHLEVPPRPGSIGVYVGVVFICVGESREVMATRGEGPGDEGRPAQTSTRGRTLPLNSARLTAPIVARIAEGKLSGEREPRNVQVDLLDAASGVTIRLRDASGIFLDLESQDQGSGKVPSGSRDEDSERPEDAPDNNGGGVARSRGASPRQQSPHDGAGDEEGDIEHIPGAGEVTLEEVVELTRERVRANRTLVDQNSELAQSLWTRIPSCRGRIRRSLRKCLT